MKEARNHLEATVKREITKLYRLFFGRGPDNASVKIFENIVYIKIEGALSKLEESLLSSKEGENIVVKIRDEMLLDQSANYVPTVESIVNAKVDEVRYVMGKKNKMMHMFLVFENDIDIE